MWCACLSACLACCRWLAGPYTLTAGPRGAQVVAKEQQHEMCTCRWQQEAQCYRQKK